MDTKNTQNTTPGLASADLRTRLIVFALVLAVGFAMGWIGGRGTATDNNGIVPQQSASQGQGAGDASSSSNDSQSSSGDSTGSAQSSSADKSSSKKNEQRTDSASDASSNNASSGDSSKSDAGSSTVAPERGPTVTEDGTYTSKDEVALYIHTYGHLPSNYIGKKKAQDRGWVPSEGNLQEVLPGMSIGGSRFYNDDGQLPDKKGRQWTECDINYQGGHRGAERIVFSNDGLIYYTSDHYKTFEQLY